MNLDEGAFKKMAEVPSTFKTNKEEDNESIEEAKLKRVLKDVQNYINLSKEQYFAHKRAAWRWDKVNTVLIILLTILSATATALALIEKNIPGFVIAIITGLSTFISTLIASIKPFDKRNNHMNSAKDFKFLMFRLVNCKGLEELEKIKEDLFSTFNEEPFLEKENSPEEVSRLWSIQPSMKIDILKDIYKEREELQKLYNLPGSQTGKNLKTKNQPRNEETIDTNVGESKFLVNDYEFNERTMREVPQSKRNKYDEARINDQVTRDTPIRNICRTGNKTGDPKIQTNENANSPVTESSFFAPKKENNLAAEENIFNSDYQLDMRRMLKKRKKYSEEQREPKKLQLTEEDIFQATAKDTSFESPQQISTSAIKNISNTDYQRDRNTAGEYEGNDERESVGLTNDPKSKDMDPKVNMSVEKTKIMPQTDGLPGRLTRVMTFTPTRKELEMPIFEKDYQYSAFEQEGKKEEAKETPVETVIVDNNQEENTNIENKISSDKTSSDQNKHKN